MKNIKNEKETVKSNISNKIDIDLNHVSHYFQKEGKPFKVLHDINISIEKNEFISIIGPSGCGKSTLLFIIAGFIKPTSGEIRHKGKIVTEPSSSRGIVFQQDAVFPWLKVFGNVEFGLKTKGLAKEEREIIVKRYLKLVQLEGSENLYPNQLSGGMRKRVDVARTFAINPEVLLLDESFGSLDTQTKEKLQIELLDIWEKEKKTAIFVTHDIEEAIFLADRVYVMSKVPGYLKEVIDVPFGRPREVDLKVSKEFTELRHYLMNAIAKL